jgi:hypothetical protein
LLIEKPTVPFKYNKNKVMSYNMKKDHFEITEDLLKFYNCSFTEFEDSEGGYYSLDIFPDKPHYDLSFLFEQNEEGVWFGYLFPYDEIVYTDMLDIVILYEKLSGKNISDLHKPLGESC